MFSATLHQIVWLNREMARPLNYICGSSSLTSVQNSLITMIPNRKVGEVFNTRAVYNISSDLKETVNDPTSRQTHGLHRSNFIFFDTLVGCKL